MRKKTIKVAPLAPERFVCYRMVCATCGDGLEYAPPHSECWCEEKADQPKTKHIGGVCKKCSRPKAKPKSPVVTVAKTKKLAKSPEKTTKVPDSAIKISAHKRAAAVKRGGKSLVLPAKKAKKK